MNEDFKRANESLPAEEKEQLQKYQKKGITKITQSVDQESGEILSTETTYSSEKKRLKGTFGISDPEEIIRLTRQSKIRAINTMLAYVIDTMDWKYLLDNKYIFSKPNKKNRFTLNVNLLFRGPIYKAAELYEEQFGQELNQDSKLELTKIKKKVTKLSKEDIKKLIEDLQKMI